MVTAAMKLKDACSLEKSYDKPRQWIKGAFNFMAAVTMGSDFGAPKNSLSLFPLFAHVFAMK